MPKLIIIAGCNGSGKSTFAPSILPDGLRNCLNYRIEWVFHQKLQKNIFWFYCKFSGKKMLDN